MTRDREDDPFAHQNMKAEDLSNLQPDIAGQGNRTPREESDVYQPGEGEPASGVDDAEDSGQQVVGEMKQREQSAG
jgi:hypothetical protein